MRWRWLATRARRSNRQPQTSWLVPTIALRCRGKVLCKQLVAIHVVPAKLAYAMAMVSRGQGSSCGEKRFDKPSSRCIVLPLQTLMSAAASPAGCSCCWRAPLNPSPVGQLHLSLRGEGRAPGVANHNGALQPCA